MFVSVCLCVLCLSFHVSVGILRVGSMSLSVCLFLCVSVYICLSLCVLVSMYVTICLCVCVCVLLLSSVALHQGKNKLWINSGMKEMTIYDEMIVLNICTSKG